MMFERQSNPDKYSISYADNDEWDTLTDGWKEFERAARGCLEIKCPHNPNLIGFIELNGMIVDNTDGIKKITFTIEEGKRPELTIERYTNEGRPDKAVGCVLT
jgi:hypothetical protein